MSSGAAPSASAPTLVSRVWPSRPDPRLSALRAGVLMVLGTLLLAISANVLLYLAEGLAGLPVFAGPAAGPAYMAGPTGGFLVGFAAAAFVTGWLAEHGWNRGLPRILAMMILGHAVIFAFGLGWLTTLMPAAKAWAVGAAPFVAATILKTALAAAVLQGAAVLTRR
jgi:biotin transport system substrate-specific component